jgi:hypothetical protein
MAGKGGQIAAELTLDTKAFQRGLDEAKKKASDMTGTLQGVLSSVAPGAGKGFDLFSSFGGVAGIATGTGLVGGLTAVFSGVADAIRDTYQEMRALGRAGIDIVGQQNRMAARFQASTDEVGALQLAADRYGVSLDSLNTAQAFFNRQLAEARRNGGAARDAFSSLGIGVEQLGGNAMALQRRILDQIAELDPANRERLARLIFGRGGGQAMETIALRAGGGAGLQQIQERGLASGAIADSEQARQIADMDRQIRAGQQALRDVSRGEYISHAPGEQRRQRNQIAANLILLGINPDEVMQPTPPPVRPNPEATRRAEQRQEAERIRDDVQQTAINWQHVNDRLTEQHATLGMNSFEVQRYRVHQERIRLEQQMQSEAMERLTVEERRKLDVQLQGLRTAEENIANLQKAHELEQERLETLTTAQRMAEAARHTLTPQAGARAALAALERDEARFGLNQTARQARAITRGSAESINQVNASALESESGNRSVAERTAAATQASAQYLERVERVLNQMREVLGTTAAAPANVG